MLKIKRLSAVVGKKVYTSEGDFFGEIQEVNLSDNKVDSWKINISNRLNKLMRSKRSYYSASVC